MAEKDKKSKKLRKKKRRMSLRVKFTYRLLLTIP